MLNKNKIENTFKTIQDEICQNLEALDGSGTFKEDLWDRPGGGGGRTRVLRKGDLIEKGGVNFSSVEGALPDAVKKQLQVEGENFFATGVSIVLHAVNPFVPIIHMNIRYFEIDGGDTYWFGGGIDLTPAYVDVEMASSFHQRLKILCDQAHGDYYTKFKKWADDYFYIPHRQETRGVGGIFFDKLQENEEMTKSDLFSFVTETGRAFYPLYEEQANKFRDQKYSDAQKKWQHIRRGRYVEFNLVYDKGTTFGLHTGGRTESILMSLPETAGWEYDHHPEPKSREALSMDYFKKNIDWINL